ncbi:MAG TPA: hypothetical protein DCY79_21670 [Planctomycetaceae bacterium]|nr:hypothetical protein [Planctomycetaceae bacterium]|tara:strand:- start:270 stop:1967 length:1698 start_codon:yes stop_codon:yes gene_type:complete
MRVPTLALVIGIPFALLAALIFFLYFFESANIETTYGRRTGTGQTSVNGTTALASMFETAGHRVFTWNRLSSKLDTADTIVWFPDCFLPPKQEEREFLEKWLAGAPKRTLVYVGRDFNAAPEYWQKMQGRVAPDQYREYVRREAKAITSHNTERAEMPSSEFAGWFTAKRGDLPRTANKLQSDAGWLDGIDPQQTNIFLQGELLTPTESDVQKKQKALRSTASDETLPTRHNNEVLLASGDTPIVSVVRDFRWRGSKIIVVTNGSFLLNLPLVNQEHRKLAGKLINECGQPRKQVVFLETGPKGAVITEILDSQNPSGLEVFTVWPMNAISLHFVALGIVTCFLLWPIFGRPKSEPRTSDSDFYQHVIALGNMLEQTRDEEFARERVAHYLQLSQRDATSETRGNAPTTPAGTPTFNLPFKATPVNAAKLAHHAVDVSSKDHHISLDYNPTSISLVDQLLNSLHAQGKAGDSAAETLAFCLGVYTGELLVRHEGGTWHACSEDPLFAQASPYMIIQLMSTDATGDQQQMILNPIGKALKQLESGASNSIQTFYRETTRHHQAGNG